MGKEETGLLSLNRNKLSFFFFYLLILFLPTQFGKHFWPSFSFVYGLRIDYLSPTLYVTDILIFLIFLLSFKEVFKKLVNVKNIILYLCLFLAFLLVGAIVSKNPFAAYLLILKLIEYFYLGIFLYFNFKDLNKNLFVVGISIGIFFETLLAIIQYINIGSFQGLFYFLGERNYSSYTPGIANAAINGSLILRPYGTFSHPNIMAGVILLCSIYIVWLRPKLNKYFIYLALAIATFCIFISLSRTAISLWLLLILSFFIFTIVEKYKKDRLNPRVINFKNTIVGLMSIILILIFLKSYPFIRLTNIGILDESVLQRKDLLMQSLRMIQINPIFGVGIHNFLNNLTPNFNSPLLIQPVHNIFLLTYAETGIIGFGAVLYLFYALLRNVIKHKNNLIGLSLIISIIFLGSFDHYLFTSQQGQLIFTLIASSLLLKRK